MTDEVQGVHSSLLSNVSSHVGNACPDPTVNLPVPQASGEQLLFTGVSALDNDHFAPKSNWCLRDKR